MRESQKAGRLRLRALQESTEAAGEDMAQDRSRFTRLAGDEAAPRVVSAFNLFQSPEPLAARMAGMFDRIGRVLEPSAGLGRLFRAVRAIEPSCHVVMVDESPDCCRELFLQTQDDNNVNLIEGDFLNQSLDIIGLFDCIIMNPPFKLGRDIRHISHARKFLAPGGRLVGLCAAGPRQREKLQPNVDQWFDLPPGSFKSEGTQVDAAIIVIDSHGPLDHQDGVHR